jgi:hypothetical protein
VPGRPVGRSDDFHAHVFQGRRYGVTVLAVAVEDHVPWNIAFGKCFSELLHDPQGVWLDGDREVENRSPCMVDDEKDIRTISRNLSWEDQRRSFTIPRFEYIPGNPPDIHAKSL